MPKSEYSAWERGEPAEIGTHSIAKHDILREYVERYLRVLTAYPGSSTFRVHLVDGFAGGGQYLVKGSSQVHLGSPLILINAVRAAEGAINEVRRKDFQIEAWYYFVERKARVLAFLKETLSGFVKPEVLERVHLFHGTFQQKLDEIIGLIRQKTGRSYRTIFILDQYGYKDVPIPLLRKIFQSLPNAEVFLTCSIGWLVSYHRTPELIERRLRETLQCDVSSGETVPPDEDIDPTLMTEELMRHIQVTLHNVFTSQTGAIHYTPFYIFSRQARRPYWFLHLANSPRANDVVKEIHWDKQNQFIHFGRPGLAMLGFDPKQVNAQKQTCLFEFDKPAREKAIDALLAELPDRIHRDFPNGVSEEALFAAICNETPASRKMIHQAIKLMRNEREFEVIDDFIRPSPQQTFFYTRHRR